MSKIILVSGAKGGVGKSAVSLAIAAWLATRNASFSIVDGDVTNPDVLRAWVDRDGNVKPGPRSVHGLPLHAKDGWISMLDLTETSGSEYLIVNLPAGNALLDASDLLSEMAQSGGIPIYLVWVINRQRDSVQLLRDTLRSINPERVVVMKNTYFGMPEKFELFDGSDTRKEIEADSGMVECFPEMSDGVTDRIINERLTLLEATEVTPGQRLGQRLEAGRFLTAACSAFDRCLPL